MKSIKELETNELTHNQASCIVGGEPVSDGYEQVYVDGGGVTHVYHCRGGNCVYIRSFSGMIA